MDELIPDNYLKIVWDRLENLLPGHEIVLKMVVSTNTALWIECAKRYIDHFHDVEFSSDYKKLRKLNLF